MNMFPIFRRLENFDRYYKIIDERTFVELYKQSGVWKEQRIKAEQYPEILRIQDMIACNFHYVALTTEEITTLFSITK